MGTSTSSSGPKSSISLDPPWLDNIELPTLPVAALADGGDTTDSDADEDEEDASSLPVMAPPRRFADARRQLGDFARTGDTGSLSRAIGHYSKTGMGGARATANRMRASASAGAGLLSVLQSASQGGNAAVSQWVSALVASGASADDVADAIVAAVAPSGGSADEESIRVSLAQSLSDLLRVDPDLDLLKLSDDSIWTLLQFFLAHEVCNRLRFDIGRLFESANLDPAIAVNRDKEMRRFVKSEVSVQLRELRKLTPNPSSTALQRLISDALAATFEAYEGTL